MDLLNTFNLIWKNDDEHYKNKVIFGVFKLNELSNDMFVPTIKTYVDVIIKPNKGIYSKNDINNFIFTRLQLNENLNKQKYDIVSNLRIKMWNLKTEITVEMLDILFSL